VEGIPTIVFQMLRERSKLRYTIGLSVQEKYILPVKTLARLDEGEVMLPDLARLDDTVFGIALQLQPHSQYDAPLQYIFQRCDVRFGAPSCKCH
jgi:hypothetical protein